ncbi:50S ribosomal protein L24 [Candidatus Riesia pediculischaeffi]|uniref:Large ribosomal subunit protein uL24 n=2 Tax=Candidatus Riesia pediculischaeffi TaxID=428411 RepID=A0A1V0HK62_9ENTR|nr:50S ribosomal protein L24 [Candidatus Riesia pediculischaeffi]ARC53217.1 hypothetical protein AOQ87_00705 [Candidatus Riesia pediculischaeffi]KIE64134.1 LSU ribosomal protein L24p (L26e) [Candidatus Riesia pediculischaeffi PTSU]
MNKVKIRLNDRVVITTGKEKHKTGIVIKVIEKKKVVVSGINIVKKHRKSKDSTNLSGGIFKEESPIDISNVAILHHETNRADKIIFKKINGKTTRVYKSDGSIVKQ